MADGGMNFLQYAAAFVAMLILAFVGLAVGLSSRTQYTVVPTVADDPSLPRVQIDGAVLHGETFGDPENRWSSSSTADPAGTIGRCCRSKH